MNTNTRHSTSSVLASRAKKSTLERAQPAPSSQRVTAHTHRAHTHARTSTSHNKEFAPSKTPSSAAFAFTTRFCALPARAPASRPGASPAARSTSPPPCSRAFPNSSPSRAAIASDMVHRTPRARDLAHTPPTARANDAHSAKKRQNSMKRQKKNVIDADETPFSRDEDAMRRARTPRACVQRLPLDAFRCVSRPVDSRASRSAVDTHADRTHGFRVRHRVYKAPRRRRPRARYARGKIIAHRLRRSRYAVVARARVDGARSVAGAVDKVKSVTVVVS